MVESAFVIEATAMQPDRKTVAVGFWETDDDASPFVVARFLPDGSFDRSFNGNGLVATRVGTCDDHATGVVVQTDGKIVVVGTSYDGGAASGITVLRYLADGSLDPTFGTRGISRLRISSGYDQANGLVVRDDTAILILGESGLAPHSRRLLVLDSDGHLETSPKFDTARSSPPLCTLGQGVLETA